MNGLTQGQEASAAGIRHVVAHALQNNTHTEANQGVRSGRGLKRCQQLIGSYYEGNVRDRRLDLRHHSSTSTSGTLSSCSSSSR